MKATRLRVQNVGIIEDATIEIDKPLLIFYGEVMQGKSTILNSLKWVMGGSFPDDIIRHGESEASIQFEAIEDGKPIVIIREWYRGRDGVTKARSIQMTRNGVPIKGPADEIARFLNPFLLDQDHMRRMTDLQRQRFLVELFAVDTSAEDADIARMSQQASELRAKVKGYGHMSLTPVEPVDTSALLAERETMLAEHRASVTAAIGEWRRLNDEHSNLERSVSAENNEIRDHNAQVETVKRDIVTAKGDMEDVRSQIKKLQAKLKAMEADQASREKWIDEHLVKLEKPMPEKPDTSSIQDRIDAVCDTSELEQKLAAAGAQNVRAEQYQRNSARAQARADDEKLILDLERKQRALKDAKVAKLSAISGQCGVPGLTFSEDGSFAFEGVSAGMLSDSQIMRLSQLLSNLYPQGFGLSLIDRGESLGKSVLTLWEEAQRQERSILVSVVGDKPAKIPEQVGAFVVEKGKVTK